ELAKDRIIRVNTMILSDIKQIPPILNQFEEMGYEGVILRTFGLLYKPNTRSMEMRKFKKFDDAEFKVIGAHLNKGVTEDQFVWVCVTNSKKGLQEKEFHAKPKGNEEEKKVWYKNRKDYEGKWLTVKFQGY